MVRLRRTVRFRGGSPFSRTRKWGASPGFTLIEVLAALVIVALGMIAAISAVSQSARNGAYLREKTLAHWIAMNVITERRLQTSPPDVAESTGQVDFAGQRWRWTMTVTQTAVETMRRMDVSVRLADAPENSSLTRLSGFYGTAVGAGAGSGLAWGGAGAPGSGDPNDDGQQNQGDDEDDERMDRPERPRPVVPPEGTPVVPDE